VSSSGVCNQCELKCIEFVHSKYLELVIPVDGIEYGMLVRGLLILLLPQSLSILPAAKRIVVFVANCLRIQAGLSAVTMSRLAVLSSMMLLSAGLDSVQSFLTRFIIPLLVVVAGCWDGRIRPSQGLAHAIIVLSTKLSSHLPFFWRHVLTAQTPTFVAIGH
jgi:hypothetical protein